MAELARMGDDERKTYNRDMTTARDTYNQIVYAKEQGLEEGREEGLKEGKLEIARKMLVKGMDVDSIAEITELTPQEIEELKVQQPSE